VATNRTLQEARNGVVWIYEMQQALAQTADRFPKVEMFDALRSLRLKEIEVGFTQQPPTRV